MGDTPPPLLSGVDERREGMQRWEKRLVEKLGPLAGDLEEFYDVCTLSDGYEARLKITRPKEEKDASSSGRPVIMLLHGGGFQVGTVEMVTRPAREFAQLFGAVVVSITYRLAPEHKFPQSVNDAWEILLWLKDHGARRFGGDVQRGFLVGGYSAGGNIASILYEQATAHALSPPLTGGFICIPPLLTEEIVPDAYRKDWTSHTEHAHDHFLSAKDIAQIIEALEPDIKSPWFSPFNSPTNHRGLPPVYIQTGEKDILRDDGLIYARVLRDAGVSVRVDNFPTLHHEAYTIFSDENSPSDLGPKASAAMAWLLGKEEAAPQST